MTRRMLAVAAMAAVLDTVSGGAAAQNPDPSMTTREGWEAGGQASTYRYEEPGSGLKISGSRIAGTLAYTGTDDKLHLFTRIDGRLAHGSLKYEGNGTIDGVPDTIFETRIVAGKDYFPSKTVSLSPYLGLGYRYLYDNASGTSSNGTAGYRRYSSYVYVPVGLTARFDMGSKWILAPMFELDFLVKGNQKSQVSDTGQGYSDVTNSQDQGYGYRAALMLQKDRWAFGPWLHYWSIKDSDVQSIGLGQSLVVPKNSTREYGVEVKYSWF